MIFCYKNDFNYVRLRHDFSLNQNDLLVNFLI